MLGVVDASYSNFRYWYGLGVTDTYAGVLFPTYASYVDDHYYAGQFYYFYSNFAVDQPDRTSSIICLSNMDTYYGASAVGTFGSYVLGYFQQGDVAGQYFSYAWLFMNRIISK